MKRKSSEANLNGPSRIRSSSVRGFLGVRSSDVRSLDATSSRGIKADDPKTSEYAFFKKFKKDAGHTCHSYPLHKEDTQLEKFESGNCTGDMNNMVKQSCKNLRTSAHVKNVTPTNAYLFLSPSPLGGPSENSGMQYQDENVFSLKRQKLRQWVADTSVPEIDELCSKGYDLVSVLLSRLFPDSSENNCHGNPMLRQADIDAKSQLFAFPESDIHVKGVQSPTRNLVESDCRQYLDNCSSACWLNGSRELILSKWDAVDSGFLTTSCANKNDRQFGYKESDCNLDGGRIASLCTKSDSSFDFPFQRYGSLAFSHIKELDQFHNPNESAVGKEPNTLLLGWDFDNGKDEQVLHMTSVNRELSRYPISSTSWCDDHQQSLGNRFSTSWLSPSSFHSNYCPNFTSMPPFCSAYYSNHDCGRCVPEDKKYFVTKLKELPLTLSCTTNYLALAEDGNVDHTCKDSSIFLSHNDHRFMSKDFSENHHLGLKALLLSSRLDLDFEWNHFPVTGFPGEHYIPTYHAFQTWEEAMCLDPTKDKCESFLDSSSVIETINDFAKDIFDIHHWSSICFQIALNREKAHPSLLDRSSQTGFDGETWYDHAESQYI